MKKICLAFILFSTMLFSQEELTINTGWYAQGKQLVQNILDPLFTRTNLTYTMQQLHPERALRNANMGLDDGDAVRVFEIANIFPHLRRVEEHFFTAAFSAFYINPSLSINSLDDIKSKRVAIVNGTKIVQKFVREKKFPTVVTTLSYEKSLLKLVNKDVDLIIVNRRSALTLIHKMHLENVIIEHKPPLILKKMYLYLHKKHEKLIPTLEKELKEMKKDGSYDAIIQEYLKSVPSDKGIIDAL